MDLKVYEKTRYQNIYRNKKNKNYVIMMSKPVKTSISRVNGKIITTLDEALKIRDNAILKQQKALETTKKEKFDDLWKEYIEECQLIKKLSYGTILKKKKTYNKFLKNQVDIYLSKTDKYFWTKYIDELKTTDKQKNEILRILNSFFNWCVEKEYLIINSLKGIHKYKVNKTEMKYWTPNEFKQFISAVEDDLTSNNRKAQAKAYLIRTFTIINFSIGCRTGELRALTFGNFDENKKTLRINHSINYDPKSKDFLSNTKTYQSQRTIDISPKLLQIVNEYKNFLINELNINVDDNMMLFYNHSINRPYSDTNIRTMFHNYCDKAKVKKIRLYDLRHTFVATMMSENWELYHISKTLGHSNFNTTVNKYGHITKEKRKELALTTDKFY